MQQLHMIPENEKVTIDSFDKIAVIGKGSFGEVFLVEKKDTRMKYALKVLQKSRLLNQNLMKYAVTERNIMTHTNHPFIVKLNYAFQNKDKLYLLMDYCPGGDLGYHLNKEHKYY